MDNRRVTVPGNAQQSNNAGNAQQESNITGNAQQSNNAGNAQQESNRTWKCTTE